MQIQVYLSAEVQSHFGISPQEIQHDTATPLSLHWESLWRCGHLVSTDDGLEHLFLFTNAVTHYSLIMVDRSQDFQRLLGSFQQHFLLALHEHGKPFPAREAEIDFQLLSGTPTPLINQMSLLGDIAIEYLIANDVDIEAAERRINSYESLSHPRSASDAVRQRISPKTVAEKADILPFNKKAAGK